MYRSYFDQLQYAINTVDCSVITAVENELADTPIVYAFGNGGHIAIAEYMTSVYRGGITADTNLKAAAVSICSNRFLLANSASEFGADYVYGRILHSMAVHSGTGLGFCHTGNSIDIINGLKVARARGLATVAFVGFDGGIILDKQLADHIIHVKSQNYGIIEDTHSAIIHAITQSIRVKNALVDAELKL
jgi:phosphoheptose isomerase